MKTKGRRDMISAPSYFVIPLSVQKSKQRKKLRFDSPGKKGMGKKEEGRIRLAGVVIFYLIKSAKSETVQKRFAFSEMGRMGNGEK